MQYYFGQLMRMIAAAFLLISTTALADPNARGHVEAIRVEDAALRIQQHSGRPSVVLLYATTCSLSRRLFPTFVSLANDYSDRSVDFLVFSTDDEEDVERIPSFLKQHGARFSPVFIRPWASGSLDRALTPLGIRVGSTWTRPLLAVRDREGRVVAQAQGITDIATIRAALEAVVP